MKSRDLALIAILLAAGAVLTAVTPNIGAITPDSVATFTVLAILLVRPKPTAAIGIGVVAGLISMFFSKSPIAWFNVVVHTCGAFVASWVVLKLAEFKVSGFPLKPAITVTAYKLVAAGMFITTMLLMGLLTPQAYFTVAWVNVLISIAVGIILVSILYPPAKALYDRQSQLAPSSQTR